MSLKGALEQTLKPQELLKIAKTVLKSLKSLLKVLFWQNIFMRDVITDK